MTATRRRSLHALALSAFILPMMMTLVGCGDDSKQGGTQIQEGEQHKAVINDMKDDMKSSRGK